MVDINEILEKEKNSKGQRMVSLDEAEVLLRNGAGISKMNK